MKDKNKIKFLILLSTFWCLVLALYFTNSLTPKNYLKVNFLDVGQGDSILFQTPNGGKIIVDGGRDKSVLTRLGNELNFYEKDIDLVIATHDDLDHVGGLIDVLKRYKVKVLLYSLPDSENFLSKELVRIANEKNTKIVHAKSIGEISTSDNLSIRILFPVKNMSGSESNDASIVTQFIFGNSKFLLTGDLAQTGEIFLANQYGESLQSNVLKLGHHGSDSSTHPKFIQTVQPDVAVVSAGKNNSFGHPHRSVVELLNKFGIKVLRTDESGTITFYSNGLNIWKE